MEGGVKAVPIRLRVAAGGSVIERQFSEGTGMGKALTFHLPKGVYQRFTAFAGLQSCIGEMGRVELTVLGDGKPLANAVVNGTDAAHGIDCDVSATSLLQLNVVSRGLDPKSNYAVWAEPVLAKKKHK